MTAHMDGQYFQLPACRELLDAYPGSRQIQEQVGALEGAIPDQPGLAVSLCRSLIETTCKTILNDHGVVIEPAWNAPKLVAESLKRLRLGQTESGDEDTALKRGAEQLVRGLNQIIQGIVEIRNVHGSAAHGSDAYAPLLDAQYAEVLARATDTTVGLLFRTHFSSTGAGPRMRFRYGEHSDFDEFIDALYDPYVIFETPLLASEALFSTDFQAYRTLLVQFRQERSPDSAAVEEADGSGGAA